MFMLLAKTQTYDPPTTRTYDDVRPVDNRASRADPVNAATLTDSTAPRSRCTTPREQQCHLASRRGTDPRRRHRALAVRARERIETFAVRGARGADHSPGDA